MRRCQSGKVGSDAVFGHLTETKGVSVTTEATGLANEELRKGSGSLTGSVDVGRQFCVRGGEGAGLGGLGESE